MAMIKVRGGTSKLEFKARELPSMDVRLRLDLYNVLPNEMELTISDKDVTKENQPIMMTRFDIGAKLREAGKSKEEINEIIDELIGENWETLYAAADDIQKQVDPIIDKINQVAAQLKKLLEQRGEEIADIILETNEKHNKMLWKKAEKYLKAEK